MSKHGHTRKGGFRSPEYNTWVSMIQRCHNPRASGFSRYGGRGITVCRRWRADFRNFLHDMGPRPSGKHTIEREDNSKGYRPGNCVWATQRVQSRNRRSNHRVGKMVVTDLASGSGMRPSTLIQRLARGMSPEEALTTPLKTIRPHEITIDGITKRAATWAREHHVPAMTFYARLRAGWEPKAALTEPAGAMGVGRKTTVMITHQGVTKSIAEWSDETGLKANTIRERLRLHPKWPSEKVLRKLR